MQFAWTERQQRSCRAKGTTRVQTGASSRSDSQSILAAHAGSHRSGFLRPQDCSYISDPRFRERLSHSAFTFSSLVAAGLLLALVLAASAFAQSDLPSAPANLRAESSDAEIQISWDDPEDSSITAYDYRLRFVPEGNWRPDWTTIANSADRTSLTVSRIQVGLTIQFQLRARNDNGPGGHASVVVTVRDAGSPPPPPPPRPSPPPPQPSNNFPTADAGPDQVGVWEGALVTLDGSASSDPEGEPLRFRWNQFSGQSVELSSLTVPNPTFTAPEGLTAEAVLRFRLLVTDPSGHFDSDTVTVTVDPDAEPPPPEDLIYYFPHLAVGAGWQTTITYINYSPEEVSCQTDFLSDDGTPLMVSFADRGTVPNRTDVLPPGGSVHQETNVELSAPLAPGWARTTCTGPVKASFLYRQHNSEGMPVAEAAVNATTVPATRFVTFAEQGEGQHGTAVGLCQSLRHTG